MSVNDNLKVVILAGGQGARFWPVSRSAKPKQFLAVSPGGESLIRATADRISPLCGRKNLIVVANQQHRALVEEQVSGCTIISEPLARNTAASIGLAALYLKKQNPDSVMVVLPADHTVKKEEELLQILREAVVAATEKEVLVTVGIQPTYAHTGYGYLKRGAAVAGRVFQVARFYEKPNAERAQMYVQSGDYFWNSGMFVWKSRVILNAIMQFMPELYRALIEIEKVLGKAEEVKVIEQVFSNLESISIDFGVLEHARNCCVVTAPDFGWNDVGSWDAWAELFEADKTGNVLVGDVLSIESKDCVVYSEKRLTALVNTNGLVVIDSGDALLICPRSEVQDVKKVVDELKKRGRGELV